MQIEEEKINKDIKSMLPEEIGQWLRKRVRLPTEAGRFYLA